MVLLSTFIKEETGSCTGWLAKGWLLVCIDFFFPDGPQIFFFQMHGPAYLLSLLTAWQNAELGYNHSKCQGKEENLTPASVKPHYVIRQTWMILPLILIQLGEDGSTPLYKWGNWCSARQTSSRDEIELWLLGPKAHELSDTPHLCQTQLSLHIWSTSRVFKDENILAPSSHSLEGGVSLTSYFILFSN